MAAGSRVMRVVLVTFHCVFVANLALARLAMSAGIPECGPAIFRGLGLGCPCNEFDGCEAGLQCSGMYNALVYKIAGMNMASGMLREPAQGFCVPCMPGDFCPSGTYTLRTPLEEELLSAQQEILKELAPMQSQRINELLSKEASDEQELIAIEEALAELSQINASALERLVTRQIRLLQPANRLDVALELTCPAGMYCPDPTTKINCSIGSYCPEASTRQTSCNIPELLLRSPRKSIRTIEDRLIVSKLATAEQLIEGNYCPLGSEDASTQCPEGFFCPTPNQTEICPVGYYCGPGSTYPSRCPFLSACPEGSSSASSSWAGFIIGAVIIVVMILAIIAANLVSKRRQQRAKAYIDEQERFREILTIAGLPQPVFRAFQDIECKVSIRFEELTLTLKNGTKVLNGVTGTFPHSQLIAVMGGSGCGKSTFLNVLCGKANYGKMGGQVLINGHEAPLHVIRSIKGFVPQDDTVHEELTVQENLFYSAEVRLPSSYTSQKRKQIVLATAELLQLTHVANSVVGSVEKRGISGGQRKRVNIGVELVAQPSVLFLDEPTSGLDATGSLAVLKGLKRLCSRGLSSIMVIHQPRYSIFELFDQVMLLGYGGFQVYLGPSTRALPYFDSFGFSLPPNENPADFFLDVIQGKVASETTPDFEVEQLYNFWRENGEEWLQNSDALISPGRAQAQNLPPSLSRFTSMQVPRLKQALVDQFHRLDADGTGSITANELLEFVQDLGQEITLEMSSNIIIIMNGGRSKTEVNMDEFLECGLMDGGAFARLLDQDSDQLHREAQLSFKKHAGGGAFASVPEGTDEGVQECNSGCEAATAAAETNVEQVEVDIEPPDISNGSGDDAACEPGETGSAARGMLSVQSKAKLHSKNDELPQIRKTRGFVGQTLIICRRSWKKYTRDWAARVFDTSIVIIVAIIIGGIQGTNWPIQRVGVNFILYLIALGVVVTTGTLRVFGDNQVVRWREVASGFNVIAIYLGQSLINLVDVTVRPVLFSAICWSFTAPGISFEYYFAISWLVAWWCSGQAYVLSLMVPKESAVLAGACVPLVFAGFLNGFNPSLQSMGAYSPMFLLTYISYARWATEALMVAYFGEQPIQFRIQSLGLFKTIGFCDFVFQTSEQNSMSLDATPEDMGNDDISLINTLVLTEESPLLQNLLVQFLSILFPGVYDKLDTPDLNSTGIIEAFNADCEVATAPEHQQLCTQLQDQYDSIAGYQQCLDASVVAAIVLLVGGFALRLVALIAIVFMNRGKMV